MLSWELGRECHLCVTQRKSECRDAHHHRSSPRRNDGQASETYSRISSGSHCHRNLENGFKETKKCHEVWNKNETFFMVLNSYINILWHHFRASHANQPNYANIRKYGEEECPNSGIQKDDRKFVVDGGKRKKILYLEQKGI